MKGIFQNDTNTRFVFESLRCPNTVQVKDMYESVNQMENKSGTKYMFVWVGTLGDVQSSFIIY